MKSAKDIVPGDIIVGYYHEDTEVAKVVSDILEVRQDSVLLSLRHVETCLPINWEYEDGDFARGATTLTNEAIKNAYKVGREGKVEVSDSNNGLIMTMMDERIPAHIINIGDELYTWTPTIKSDMFRSVEECPQFANEDTINFHATFKDGWKDSHVEYEEENGEPLMVHMGSLTAALERIDTLSMRNNDNDATFYIHETRMAKDTVISENLLMDVFDGWYEGWNPTIHCNTDAFYYRNSVEDKRSLSVYARADKVEIIATHEFTLSELDWESIGYSDIRTINDLYGYIVKSVKVTANAA